MVHRAMVEEGIRQVAFGGITQSENHGAEQSRSHATTAV